MSSAQWDQIMKTKNNHLALFCIPPSWRMNFEEGYHVKGLVFRYFTMTIVQQKKDLLWLSFSTIINTVDLLFVSFKLIDFFPQPGNA